MVGIAHGTGHDLIFLRLDLCVLTLRSTLHTLLIKVKRTLRMAHNDGLNGAKEEMTTMQQVETMTNGCGEQINLMNDDDDSEAESITMFEQDDFEKETWGSVVTPTNIAGIIAGVGLFSVMNPLVFVSLAATTVGAYHVVSHAQELLLEEYEIWKNGSPTKGTITDASESGSSEEGTVSARQNGDKEAMQREPERQESLRSVDSPTSTLIAPNTTFETIKSSDDEETSYSNVLSQRFPPLEDEILCNQTFEGLNALEFFNVFLSDDAPFSFREFQLKRGDFDITYGPWTSPTKQDSISFHKMQHLQRTISFKTLTKNFFGPPHATCNKHQEVYMNKRVLIMETKVTLEGVPFCDRFYVQERWIMQAPKSSINHNNKVARLSIFSQVHFLQPCAFEQQIHSKSRSTLQEVVASWSTMAQEALAITIQHKLERERHGMSHVKSECSIEVAHSASSGKSFVVGEDENEPPPTFPPITVQVETPRKQRQQPLQSLKRSVLSRMTSKKLNPA